MENEQRKYWFFGSKLNTALLLILIILMVVALRWMYQNKQTYSLLPSPDGPGETLQYGEDNNTQIKDTYTYTNHGFSIELPKGFIPTEMKGENVPNLFVSLPKGGLIYGSVSDWEKYTLPSYTYIKDQKIGETIFKTYVYDGVTSYWFKQGNVSYEFNNIDQDILKTFKFIGWPQTKEYNQDNISFSYAKEVTLNSFVASGGYRVINLNKKDSQAQVTMNYAEKSSEGARAMYGCFEMLATKITIGNNIFTRCASKAEPSYTYVLSGKTMVINIIINNFDYLTKIEDFIDLSSIKIN